MLRHRAWALVALPVLAVGGGAPEAASDPSAAYRVVKVEHPGTIEGACRLAEAMTVPIVPVKACSPDCTRKEEPSEAIVFDPETLALADCLVSIREVREGKEWPEAMAGKERQALITIEDCRYVPHAQWAAPETQLGFWNSHARGNFNVHGFFGEERVTQFNFGVGPRVRVDDNADAFLRRPGRYLVTCDLSCNMSAVVWVFDHPYVAGPTKKDGRYRIDAVPPGTYEVVCWHEDMAKPVGTEAWRQAKRSLPPDVRLVEKVEVPPDGTVRLDFTIPVPAR